MTAVSNYEEANKDKKRSIVIKETESEAEAEYGRLQRSSWRHFVGTEVQTTCGEFVREGERPIVALCTQKSLCLRADSTWIFTTRRKESVIDEEGEEGRQAEVGGAK